MAQFISAPILGAISDRYGRRLVMLICLSGVTVGFSIFAIGGALWVLFAAWIVVGAMDGMMGIAFSYIVDTTKPIPTGWVRSRLLLLLRSCSSQCRNLCVSITRIV